jgi:hypothetical protein
MKTVWLLELVIGVPGQPAWVTFGLSDLNLIVTADTEEQARKLADESRPNVNDRTPGIVIEHPYLSRKYCRAVLP